MKTGGEIVALEGCAIRLAEDLAFRDTHWVFMRGQNWVLVGANDSGKTLFACALAGQAPLVGGSFAYRFRPRAGETHEEAVALLTFDQQRMASGRGPAGDGPAAIRWDSAAGEAAETVQHFLSRKSVYEINPYEIRKERPGTEDAYRNRMKRTAAMMEIESLMSRALPALSHGEMRRVLIARALLNRPRLLILDDPFAGLDAAFRVQLKRLLAELMRTGMAHILLVVKNHEEIPRGITHLLFVEGCRVAAQGPLGRMLRQPRVRAVLEDNGTAAARGIRLPVCAHRRRPPADAEIIRMEEVSVSYDGHAVLQQVNWCVRRFEHWAISGPNGAGKSTLLSLVIGDNPQAYANRVFLFGRRRGDGGSVWDLKRRIGWVSPELHLHFPQMQSCLEAVLSGFYDADACYRVPSAAQRRTARDWLECFGLQAYSHESFGALSFGLQRLALLARALVKLPELLVLDEPCQGMDPEHRHMILRVVEELMMRNLATILYVTHHPEEVPCGIRCRLRLDHGRAVASGRIRVSPSPAG